MAVRLKAVILNQLDELEALETQALLERRYERLRGYGAFTGG
jgi:acetyl-CoA carboxylase carboxyl transferase subunit alpha